MQRSHILESPGESTAITRLKFVSNPTRNQVHAVKLYTEVLAFHIASDQPLNEQQRWTEPRIANSATCVVLFTPPGPEDRIGPFFNGSFA